MDYANLPAVQEYREWLASIESDFEAENMALYDEKPEVIPTWPACPKCHSSDLIDQLEGDFEVTLCHRCGFVLARACIKCGKDHFLE